MMRVTLSACCLALLLATPASLYAADIKIAAWNLEWFFDDDQSDNSSNLSKEQSAPSAAEFTDRVEMFADAIIELDPDIMSLEEIENKKVVKAITDRIEQKMGPKYNIAFVQGEDTFTEQDVAVLLKDGITFAEERFSFTHDSDGAYKDLSKHLHVIANVNGHEFHIVAVHLITKTDPRRKQAKTLREWITPLLDKNLVVLGDFNVSLPYENTSNNSDIGEIRGLKTHTNEDDLEDAHAYLEQNQRATHVSGRQLDRILMSPPLTDEEGLEFQLIVRRKDLAIKGTQDVGSGVHYELPPEEQDLSDHFPILALFSDLTHDQ